MNNQESPTIAVKLKNKNPIEIQEKKQNTKWTLGTKMSLHTYKVTLKFAYVWCGVVKSISR